MNSKTQQASFHLIAWATAVLALPILVYQIAPTVKLIPMPFAYLGVPIMVVGLALLIWVVIVLDRHNTTLNPILDPSELIVDGPFSISRNPMYLGALVTYVGLAVLLGSLTAWVFPILFFVVAHWLLIPYEEAILEHIFSAAYLGYRRRVRRWI